MKPNEINEAIAKACGWKYELGEWRRPHKDSQCVVRNTSDGDERVYPPSYCTDLNAMADAEKTIDNWPLKDVEAYLNHLLMTTGYFDKKTWIHANVDLNCATAAQRAEAFLRTIGKWKE